MRGCEQGQATPQQALLEALMSGQPLQQQHPFPHLQPIFPQPISYMPVLGLVCHLCSVSFSMPVTCGVCVVSSAPAPGAPVANIMHESVWRLWEYPEALHIGGQSVLRACLQVQPPPAENGQQQQPRYAPVLAPVVPMMMPYGMMPYSTAHIHFAGQQQPVPPGAHPQQPQQQPRLIPNFLQGAEQDA